MKQIGFAKDADDALLAVDDRQGADIVIHQKLHCFRNFVFGPDCHDVADHHIARVHSLPPNSRRWHFTLLQVLV